MDTALQESVQELPIHQTEILFQHLKLIFVQTLICLQILVYTPQIILDMAFVQKESFLVLVHQLFFFKLVFWFILALHFYF